MDLVTPSQVTQGPVVRWNPSMMPIKGAFTRLFLGFPYLDKVTPGLQAG